MGPSMPPYASTAIRFALLAEFRIFDEKYTILQKIKIFFVTLLLNMVGGFLSIIPHATPDHNFSACRLEADVSGC